MSKVVNNDEGAAAGEASKTKRRRTLHACIRCRRHKIKCSGAQPCERCARRHLTCVFGDKKQHYSPSYVRDLQRRVAAAEQGHLDDAPAASLPAVRANTLLSPTSRTNESGSTIEVRPRHGSGPSPNPGDVSSPARRSDAQEDNGGHVNTLAIGQSVFVPDARGRPFYLGTSSSWSFSRRVLLAAHDRIMQSPMMAEELLFPGESYDLGWDGDRESLPSISSILLPHADFAMYLVNTVKFYVGQLFHLFEEQDFMGNFRNFHDPECDSPSIQSLWYKHYLLVLAFGKAFVAKDHHSLNSRPAGSELFVQAMATLPNFIFCDVDPFEHIEVLCCAALYLQSLDLRLSSYKMIGEALRIALDHGLHTDIQNYYVPEHRVQRARKIWWTVHLLDRQMSSAQGLPFAMRDEDITVNLPSFASSAQKRSVLETHIELSKVMAMIVNNIYGKEGRLDTKFLVHTKAALKGVAKVTTTLNERELGISMDRPDATISRVSAYMHLLQHECIIIATRPILFNFFEARLAHNEEAPREDVDPPESVWALLQMCRDSALQSLKILHILKKQGLLESFLPFDLNATYTSAIVLFMASHIDIPLLEDHGVWTKMAAEFLEEMEVRGNKIARRLRLELDKLDSILSQLPRGTKSSRQMSEGGHYPCHSEGEVGSEPGPITDESVEWLDDASFWNDTLNPEQLTVVAESIDLDGMDWWFNASLDE